MRKITFPRRMVLLLFVRKPVSHRNQWPVPTRSITTVEQAQEDPVNAHVPSREKTKGMWRSSPRHIQHWHTLPAPGVGFSAAACEESPQLLASSSGFLVWPGVILPIPKNILARILSLVVSWACFLTVKIPGSKSFFSFWSHFSS